MSLDTKSVFVSVVGRPNAGKSSLVNRLVGEKVAIVTSKPQTTRTRITGVLTEGAVQYVFLDTPGMHRPRTKLGARMTQAVTRTLGDADIVVMLFEPVAPLNEVEQELVRSIKAQDMPAIAAVNKEDAIKDKAEVEAKCAEVQALGAFKQVLAISAATGDGCDELLTQLSAHALEGPHYFSDDEYTDQPEKQLAAEIIREKLLLHLQQEIPHGTAVEVQRFKERGDVPIVDIEASIYCERKSHKGMIIGKGGQMLKTIASEARYDIEEMLDTKVNLKCWVKVKEDWRDNEFLLNNFGFEK